MQNHPKAEGTVANKEPPVRAFRASFGDRINFIPENAANRANSNIVAVRSLIQTQVSRDDLMEEFEVLTSIWATMDLDVSDTRRRDKQRRD